MAATTYKLFFGTANAGGTPTWTKFARADTGAALTQPTITEDGNGLYAFGVDWTLQPVTSIEYIATLNGVEVWDIIQSAEAQTPGTVAITAGTLNLNGYSTAGTILNRVATQVNLKTRADPLDGLDQNFTQMVEFLTTAGYDLCRQHTWTHLIREFTLTTDGSTQSYALPADFFDLVDQTEWNRTSRLPMIGPVSSQQAQFLKARLPALVINIIFRIQGNLITLPVVPPTAATCAAEYLSTYWVKSAAGTSPDMDHPGSKDDVCLFDPTLLVRAVKLQWLQAKGFDATIAQSEYDSTLASAIERNTGAQIISLSGQGRYSYDRLINGNQVPEGFWNQ